jgi:hypothetical protein
MTRFLPPGTEEEPDFRDAATLPRSEEASKGSLDWTSLAQKLYGREEEARTLEEAYRRCTSMDSPLELVLVMGRLVRVRRR